MSLNEFVLNYDDYSDLQKEDNDKMGVFFLFLVFLGVGNWIVVKTVYFFYFDQNSSHNVDSTY